ncbi:hypothetical protein [Catenulispora pinisilvae]|uniref:hypothetical protein n=1 Tax=Catenulispora pinisilvae TaxID=2705253 RepID=UPI001891573F|nr:hypothetical protein [Catenulispora pinisilvae]
MATSRRRRDVNTFGVISGNNNQIASGSGSHKQTMHIENTSSVDPLPALLGSLRELQASLDVAPDPAAADAARKAVTDLAKTVSGPQRDKSHVAAALRKAQGLAVQALGLTETIAGLDQAVAALFR